MLNMDENNVTFVISMGKQSQEKKKKFPKLSFTYQSETQELASVTVLLSAIVLGCFKQAKIHDMPLCNVSLPCLPSTDGGYLPALESGLAL